MMRIRDLSDASRKIEQEKTSKRNPKLSKNKKLLTGPHVALAPMKLRSSPGLPSPQQFIAAHKTKVLAVRNLHRLKFLLAHLLV